MTLNQNFIESFYNRDPIVGLNDEWDKIEQGSNSDDSVEAIDVKNKRIKK